MRVLLVLVLVLASGCPKRMVRHVYVPKSSAACWRECKAQSIECLKTRFQGGFEQQRREEFCEDERLECLLTCDGAYETAPVEEP